MLKWAALLHDIRKRSLPELVGKDHVHPFTSAASTLISMHSMGVIKLANADEEGRFARLCDLVEKSQEPINVNFRGACKFRHSHEHLLDIFSMMWNPETPWSTNWAERGGFVDLVFRLVLFH